MLWKLVDINIYDKPVLVIWHKISRLQLIVKSIPSHRGCRKSWLVEDVKHMRNYWKSLFM